MVNKLLHTPNGVRDIYGVECSRKISLENKIRHTFQLFGYQDIQTPTFEFIDIFHESRGSVSTDEMFKFFDRDNHTLVLRPDETPAIARCITKYFPDETIPVRLCYLERAFVNNIGYQGRLQEVTQTGVELIGDDSSDADAEMIVMMIQALLSSGLTEFQVELGQAEFFLGLLEEADMDSETEKQLCELIENKNYFGLQELVLTHSVPENSACIFLKFPELFGSLEQIQSVKTMTQNTRALKAIKRLEEVYHILEYYKIEEYVSFDLGMLSQYEYYTGIIFKAYTYGTGDYIVNGGRYDKLLIQFGKDAPAVGFAISIDKLMLALSAQKIQLPGFSVPNIILYETGCCKEAVSLASCLRNSDSPVEMICKSAEISLESYIAYGADNSILTLWYLRQDETLVQRFNLKSGEWKEIPLSECMEGGVA